MISFYLALCHSIPMKAAVSINVMHRITSYTSIQGVIGAGKSTFIRRLRENISASGQCAVNCTDFTLSDYYLVVDEPVDEWEVVNCSLTTKGEEKGRLYSILDIFYTDMKRWAFTFQVNAFTTRLRRIVTALDSINPGIPETARIHIIAERSLRTDYLFFRNLYVSGLVSRVDWKVYKAFFHTICDETINKEDRMIYIDTAPVKCHERIKKRDRKEETSRVQTPEEEEKFGQYLVSLHKAHQSMIDAFRSERGHDRVYVIDANKDIESMVEYDSMVAEFRTAALCA